MAKGTTFRKADLHIHTPASACYLDKTVTATQIVEEAIRKGLDIVAVTDHNDIASIDDIRTEAAKKGLIVFPGIEISSKESHLIALFEPDYPVSRLDEFLPAIGIFKEDRGKKEAMAGSFEEVLLKVREFGGISIAPHVTSDNGILHSSKKGAYKQGVCRNQDLCALELLRQDYVENFTCGKVPNYPAKACVCGSDAHSLAEIGQRFAYLKLDVVSIDGLKHALADWPVRVRFPWDSVVSTHPRICSLKVDQGFFKDAHFEFHPNLTCLVGGTGTGKSTVIEFLRYCFNDISLFEDIAEDTYGKVGKLVGGGGKISIDYVMNNGEEVMITREVSDPLYREQVSVSVKDKNGDEALLTSRPVFFSQGEIVRIAKNPIAQLELIDRYIDISNENRTELELTSALETNGSAISEILDNLHSLKEEIEDPTTGKASVEKERDRLQEQLKNPIFTEFPKWESEDRFISQTLVGIDNAQEAVKNALSEIVLEDYFPKGLETGNPNYGILSSLNDVTKTLGVTIDNLKKQVGTDVAAVKSQTEKARDEWNPLFVAKKAEYDDYMKKLGTDDINRAQKHLRALNERLGELETIGKKVGSLAARETKVREERQNLLK